MAEWIEEVYSAMRDAFGKRYVRHSGHSYTAPPSTSTSALDGAGMVLVDGAAGSVRLLTSEVKKPHPKTMDGLDIKNVVTGAWEPFVIVDVSPQHNGATLLISYGETF